jgi:hypothetical protein
MTLSANAIAKIPMERGEVGHRPTLRAIFKYIFIDIIHYFTVGNLLAISSIGIRKPSFSEKSLKGVF